MDSKRNRATSRGTGLVDIHVGERIRIRRLALRVSQGDLGAEVGVTFQQIQKYELGTNRVSASRLQKLAEVLGVSVSYFFEDLPGQGEQAAENWKAEERHRILPTLEGIRFNQAFLQIQSTEVRRRIMALMKALATEDEQDDRPLQ
ncbi:hypothetical protein BJF92_09260 [Rhizobium rhizosphaerae]|uniref:HTH cro/C1-type domain-containing protein n=1 Tax=Xaviernesmea rhizosphaerae TaxID=1672749 RepID=A0A1Q9AKK1_9HYPH|nr:helix-turn-helix transcriptional regulator [Xaviernesmea rhizosphaerae]OLP55807.1 hypothetical protein BJF92_09260 [Xaviernesmea rhizosphaerae]